MNAETAVPDCARELLEVIQNSMPRLLALDEASTARRPAPGKWSPREIIGHLIDSASNNHQRFVRAQFQESLVFPGYAQDDWVEVQRYQEAAWPELVDLWALFNRHIARVMTGMALATRMRERTEHNLDEIAFRMLPADQPATLDWLMCDYVTHLRHHLRQIPALRS